VLSSLTEKSEKEGTSKGPKEERGRLACLVGRREIAELFLVDQNDPTINPKSGWIWVQAQQKEAKTPKIPPTYGGGKDHRND